MKSKLITSSIFMLSGVYISLMPNVQAEFTLNEIIQSNQSCEIESIQNALLCGKFNGRLNTLYYSTHNAFFDPNINQDTITTGGFIKYETQAVSGLTAGLSYAGQWRLDDKYPRKDEVYELSQEKDGLAEAYLNWQNQDFKVRVGQQSLDIPFVGNFDWRVMPPLYRAIDIQYGSQHDFIRVTGSDRFKSYADDQFTQTSRYSSTHETDGMWSIGVGKHFKFQNKDVTTQAWYQSYDNYNQLGYLEGHVKWSDLKYKPDLGVQSMWSKSQGKALAGNTDHSGIGISLALNVIDKMTLKTAYNYIKPDQDSYLNGSLFTTYMIYTASGPYFAQPFFTSTQDLGAGNAWMISLDGPLNDQTYVGANYSFMDLKENSTVKSLNQSEYVIYGIYNFKGALKGWSIADFLGVVTSPRYDDTFIQNRLALKYQF